MKHQIKEPSSCFKTFKGKPYKDRNREKFYQHNEYNIFWLKVLLEGQVFIVKQQKIIIIKTCNGIHIFFCLDVLVFLEMSSPLESL